MRILVVRGRGIIAPHVMDSYTAAFRQLEYSVKVLDISNGFSQKQLEEVCYFNPDLVLCYGCTGAIKIEEGYLFRCLQKPLINLYYDSPFFAINDEFIAEISAYPDYYYSFVWDNKFLELLKAKGIKNCYKIMLALDDTQMFPVHVAHFKNALSFVGSINSDSEKLVFQYDFINNFINDVIEAKLFNLDKPVLDIIDSMLNGNQSYSQIKAIYDKNEYYFWKEIYYNIHLKGSAFYRRYTLSIIDDIDIYIYGNTDICKSNIHPMNKVAYGRDLAEAYNSYSVNLNLSSFQLETSINNRVFDCFGSKAFVLSDYKQELEEVFPKHFEAVSFRSLEELGTKGEYYLSHDKERTEITQDLYDIVIKHHTYRDRVKYIMSIVTK